MVSVSFMFNLFGSLLVPLILAVIAAHLLLGRVGRGVRPQRPGARGRGTRARPRRAAARGRGPGSTPRLAAPTPSRAASLDASRSRTTASARQTQSASASASAAWASAWIEGARSSGERRSKRRPRLARLSGCGRRRACRWGCPAGRSGRPRPGRRDGGAGCFPASRGRGLTGSRWTDRPPAVRARTESSGGRGERRGHDRSRRCGCGRCGAGRRGATV